MKYVQKEREREGVSENEMGRESYEEQGGKKVSLCVCTHVCAE